MTHIYMHQMVQPKTLATWFHMAEHQEYAAGAKYDMMQQNMSNESSQPINKERLSPMGAVAPLKQEMKTSTQTPVA